MSEPLRILLGPSASKALTDAGDAAFIVIGKASHPDDPTRWAIHLIPCPIAAVNDACDVAQGKAKATRPKKDKATADQYARAREAQPVAFSRDIARAREGTDDK